MNIGAVQIADTFAEAFTMWAARVVITAVDTRWAEAAARTMTGFATSIIGCQCEAGIETVLQAEQTPDRRPGVSVLLFARDKAALGKRLVERIGQCVMTCPTTACFSGLDGEHSVAVGSRLRYFGDGFQVSKKLGDRRYWRIPVMDGEFIVAERFAVQQAVAGGNIILLGGAARQTLAAATAAVKAMRRVDDVILPFPDGVVRSGSKVGSRYASLPASTNHVYCPTLRAVTDTLLADDIHCALELVIDGLTEEAVKAAMRAGIVAAAEHSPEYSKEQGAERDTEPGIRQISAGNYGGSLGQYHLGLHAIMAGGDDATA